MVRFPSKDDSDFVRWVEAMSNQWNDLMEQKTFGYAYRISIANTKPFVEASDR